MNKLLFFLVGVLIGINVFQHYQIQDLNYRNYLSEVYGAKNYYGRICDNSKVHTDICNAAEGSFEDWQKFYEANSKNLSYGIFHAVMTK